jgi:hypothetical protein
MSTKRHTEQQIDRLLLEQGEYHPLEFLLQEGRLSYSDYEAWRKGEIRDLSEMLFGDPQQIANTLEQAATYLQRLGWESEHLVYKQRGRPDSRPLRFSPESRLDDSFHRAYRKPQDQPQLDLFTDTSSTYLINGITQGLKMLNAADARQSLQQLSESVPDHSQLGELERLVEALESLDAAPTDPQTEMQRLQLETTLLAERHLNRASQYLLTPLWRRLTQALREYTFDPAHPQLHASYAASEARDWAGAREAIERETEWQRQPQLLERHARASTHLSEQAAALQSWCLLCWQFPELGDRLESSGDTILERCWQEFLDLDPELPTQDFPAWLILQTPGLANIAPDNDSQLPCPDSYHSLLQLQRVEQQAGNDMALRAKLKQQAPQLFEYFLESRK